MKKFAIVLSLVGLVVLTFFAGSRFLKSESSALKASTADCPNLVLIYTDDIDCESVFFDWKQSSKDPNFPVHSPNLKRLADEGMSFTNFHVTTPVCGPSRACLYSGNYAHRNNVRVNDPTSKFALGFSGGYDEFNRTDEIGHWMKADFYAYLGARYLDVYWTDCKIHGLARTGEVYRTDAEADHCIKVIRQHAKRPGDQPLFLCWAPMAAHQAENNGPMVADRHLDLEVEPRPPQLEICRDLTSEKLPPHLRNLKPYSKPEEERLVGFWQNRLRSIKALDERIADVRKALEETGQLKNTIFMFTSDHGYELGAHRHDDIDGRDFGDLFDNPTCNLDPPRNAIMIENWEVETARGIVIDALYCAMRTHKHIYTEWGNGAREYYDIEADPEQINNLFDSLDDQKKKQLWNQIREL